MRLVFMLILRILNFSRRGLASPKSPASISSATKLCLSTYPPIVSVTEAMRLQTEYPENVKFIDGSWSLDKTRDVYQEYLNLHISGSVWFDLEGISDKSSNLPHMLPSSEFFAKRISDMGISSTDHLIIYTSDGCFSGPRVWWTFKAFSHDKVSVLDGGLNAWKSAGGETESGPLAKEIKVGKFESELNKDFVFDWNQVLAVVNNGFAQIVDARSSGRFKAQAPEPRPHLKGGHIPGSLNIPFNHLFNDDSYTTFKSAEELKKIFEDAGVILESGSKVVTTCGSGVSAAVLTFALHLLGRNLSSVPVYDGSWSEWGAREDLPITK